VGMHNVFSEWAELMRTCRGVLLAPPWSGRGL
jgi:hypothetical protein